MLIKFFLSKKMDVSVIDYKESLGLCIYEGIFTCIML